MKRALITGADGFTGRYLAPLLRSRGYVVHGLVAHPPGHAVEGVDAVHVADLTDGDRLRAAVADIRPSAIVHLGGISFVVGDATEMYEVNLIGTRKLLEAAAALSDPPEAILLASSANVYGNATEGMLDESMPPAPANDYAVSKLAMEYVAKLYAHRLPLILCRPFNYTGVGQAETFLLPKIVAHARRSAELIELGNLDVARDFSDVRDVVRTYAQLLETPAAIGQTLNVCSGRAFTLREVLGMVADVTGRDMAVRVMPAFVRANDVRTLLGSRARIDALLNDGVQKIPLVDTVRWMIES